MHEYIKDPTVGNESGIEADPQPQWQWVLPDSKPTILYSSVHVSRSVISVVKPSDGELSTLIIAIQLSQHERERC